jgi:hypothetical protein
LGLEKFDPALAVHDLIHDLKWSVELRAEFATTKLPCLIAYPLREDERRAIETRNFLALYDMGLHPYLGGQLARLIFGNEAGKGATVAVNKLVESLQGKGSVA